MGSEKRGQKKFFWLKAFLLSFAVILIFYGVFVFGYALGKKGIDLGLNIGPAKITNTEKGKPALVDFSLFWEAWDKLNKDYVESTNAQDLVYGAISGMLSSTGDPYTVFMKPDENKRFMDDIKGEFDGIGVEITQVNGLPTVVAPLSGTPAEKAGLKPKDVILEVDGKKTSEIGFEETINKIRGEKGTEVELTIVRDGTPDPIKVKIKRDSIKVASVNFEEKKINGKKIAYIKVRQFGDDTKELFANAVSNISGKGYDGIIIDLRNNPGGYLETAVDLSSYFVPDGVVVSEIDKNGSKKDFKTTEKASLKDIKTVVLVNQGSASASEIMAGALKDRNKSKIVGEKTFGKGSVQIMENLSDNSAVKITIAKWLTPNGNHIDKVGISPDVEIKDNENTTIDEQLNKALEQF